MDLNKESVVSYFTDFYNFNDPEKAERIVNAKLSDDFVDHSPAFGATPDAKGFLQTVKLINSVFKQDYKIEKLISENNFYVGIWSSKVEHVGELLGVPATNNVFTLTGITIYEIVEGKVKAHWEKFDIPVILQELGILK